MSLIELVFRRPSNERKLTFTEIATHCELKPDEVSMRVKGILKLVCVSCECMCWLGSGVDVNVWTWMLLWT